jgi:hypothetical protein
MPLTIDVELPADLDRYRLPVAVAARLRSLLDRQDAGTPLAEAERAEAVGLADLADLLSLLRLRAEWVAGSVRVPPLRLGDRIRLVRTPPIWDEEGHDVPRSTRSAYRRLMSRRRPLVVSEIDERGLPWISARFKRPTSGWEDHSFVVDDGCWIRVKPRGRQSSA